MQMVRQNLGFPTFIIRPRAPTDGYQRAHVNIGASLLQTVSTEYLS